jgi:hypothetical protein
MGTEIRRSRITFRSRFFAWVRVGNLQPGEFLAGPWVPQPDGAVLGTGPGQPPAPAPKLS